MLRTLGADLVGMSTVHETIAARAAGAQVLAVSLVTNLAAGMTGQPLSHDEVLEAGRQSATRMGSLLAAVIAPSSDRPTRSAHPHHAAGQSAAPRTASARIRTTCAAMMNVTFDPVSTAVASTAYTPPGLVARYPSSGVSPATWASTHAEAGGGDAEHDDQADRRGQHPPDRAQRLAGERQPACQPISM